jgi:mannose-1-phosphate guanylyltransferase
MAITTADDAALDGVYNAQEGAILDHVLSEKMKGAHVVACTFDWIDIGNFHDLHSVSKQDADANTQRGNTHLLDTTSSFIVNETDTPVAVIGLDNVAVIATNAGIVIVNKSQSRKVGDVAKKIQG